jgi:hypothetical protein
MAFQVLADHCVDVFDSRVLCRGQVVNPGRLAGILVDRCPSISEKRAAPAMIDVTPIRAVINLLKPAPIYIASIRAGVDRFRPVAFIDACATAPEMPRS